MWPESATPFYFEHDLLRGAAIRRLARDAGVTLLIGSDQVEPIRAERDGTKPTERYYNAAFLVQPDGQIGAVYRKMHLVPFGEYVPLQRLLFFVGPIVEAVSAVHARVRARCCCRSAITRSAPRSATRSIFAESHPGIRRWTAASC